MDLIKLLIIFILLIAVLRLGKPLYAALLISAAAAAALYRIPFSAAAAAVKKGAFEWPTIETLLVLYFITYLQRMLERRNNLSNARRALNGLFHNNRINASLVPFLLGMLPAASTVLICGPIVRESVKDSLDNPEKACITSYYRHISESFLPTYTGIFIAVTLTNGLVTVSGFLLAMIPMIAALFFCGWAVYLRKVPKDTGETAEGSRGEYLILLLKSIWSILLTIALILIFNFPVEAAVMCCIIINVFVNHFSATELKEFIANAFEFKLILNTWLIMIFKEVLAATGVISELPVFFGQLPLPAFLSLALLFFFGAVIAGSQAIIVLCMPMAMASLEAGQPALPLFVLLMCMNYAAMQCTPIHICLGLCAEDYGISLGKLIGKSLPLVGLFCVFAFLYYGFLNYLHI